MGHNCVHVAIEGTAEAWTSVRERLQAAPEVQLVMGVGADDRVDVVFYDVGDVAAACQLDLPEAERGFWTIGVDLAAQRVVELSSSQYTLTSVDDVAAVLRASGCALRPPRPRARFETGD
jgi:hypothetical protein